MKLISSIFLMAMLVASAASAKVFTTSEGSNVFYRYSKAKKGQPSVVLLNGLIYSVSNWDSYYNELKDKGVGVLQIAYSTQPESLKTLDGESPSYNDLQWTFFGWQQKGIETQDQVNEVMEVVNHVGLKKFNLVSLSYGSIVASSLAVQQKHRIKNLILMAPAMVTSGRYNPYGASRHSYYTFLKAAGNPAADYSYDMEIYSTLSFVVTPDKYNFKGVEFKDFFDGVYQMARSSKWFDLKEYAANDLPPTYMFIASREDGPLLEDQKKFWFLMNDNPAQKGLVVFEGSYHAIPGVAPVESAKQTLRILKGKNKSAETTVVVEPDATLPGTTIQSLINSTEWASGQE